MDRRRGRDSYNVQDGLTDANGTAYITANYVYSDDHMHTHTHTHTLLEKMCMIEARVTIILKIKQAPINKRTYTDIKFALRQHKTRVTISQ